MTLTHRIQHITIVVAILVGIALWGAVRWPLFRPYEPLALDPFAAAERYGQDSEALSTSYYEQLPPGLNQRTVAYLQGIERGTIYDRIGRPLAYDEAGYRIYSDIYAAHLVGYVSQIGTGLSGIEYTYNETLLGRERLDNRWAALANRQQVGNDVHLTIDSRIQQVATNALGGERGAVVVLNAETGEVYALASTPTFDPNRLLNDRSYGAELLSCADSCDYTLFNRAAEGLYAPGSTWKTVSLAAALDSGQISAETQFDFSPTLYTDQGSPYYTYEVEGGIIEDHNHVESILDVTGAYATSANAAFAEIGAEMSAEQMIAYSEGFGFSRNVVPPLEITTAGAQLANSMENLENSALFRAHTAIGQGELLASPLHIALMSATIINEGNVPAPYLVKMVKTPNARTTQETQPTTWLPNSVSAATAATMREMMIAAVTDGTGTQAQIAGHVVGGKTGTAQVGDEDTEPHAWFTGFIESEQATLALAVIVENGGEGSQVAAPIFAEVGQAALTYLGLSSVQPVVEIDTLDLATHSADNRPIIYLTFDDGPHPTYTQQVLTLLKQYDATATFFVTGQNVRRYPELAQQIVADGHKISNHTLTHRTLKGLERSAFFDEINQAQLIIEATTGIATGQRLLRPPFGLFDAEGVALAAEFNYLPVFWDIDPKDWQQSEAAPISEQVLAEAYPGAVVLLHDGGGDRAPTVAALGEILRGLAADGYVFEEINSE